MIDKKIKYEIWSNLSKNKIYTLNKLSYIRAKL